MFVSFYLFFLFLFLLFFELLKKFKLKTKTHKNDRASNDVSNVEEGNYCVLNVGRQVTRLEPPPKTSKVATAFINKRIEPSFEINQITGDNITNEKKKNNLIKISCYNKHFVAINDTGDAFTWSNTLCEHGELGFGKDNTQISRFEHLFFLCVCVFFLLRHALSFFFLIAYIFFV